LLNLVDAAVIAVPTIHHHQVARDFLEHEIPLLVEKPLTTTVPEAQALVALARERDTLLQVGHVERFNPAFEQLQRRPLRPMFVESHRVGPFTGRSTDIGVVLDLMIHDLDLLLALVKAPVQSVEALGAALLGGHEDVVHARLTFANGCMANLTASRITPRPVRRMRIWAPEGYVGVDFARRHLVMVQPSDQLRQHGLDPRLLVPAARDRLKQELFDIHLKSCEVDCDHGDQLTQELRQFIFSVQTGQPPRVSGEDGLRALEAATRILESVRAHRWNDDPEGPVGPAQMPAALGPLFTAEDRGAAA
jgi:predicted dehydrogenase